MLDEKSDQKMVKHEREEKKEVETFFKAVFQAESAEILETTKGYKIVSVMIITRKDGSVIKLGLLENI
jgi:hypothetical protein